MPLYAPRARACPGRWLPPKEASNRGPARFSGLLRVALVLVQRELGDVVPRAYMSNVPVSMRLFAPNLVLRLLHIIHGKPL
eukprot:15454295-Alexandrium_andersonii.AAC.1